MGLVRSHDVEAALKLRHLVVAEGVSHEGQADEVATQLLQIGREERPVAAGE
jgi:hypothetical protein